MGSEVLPGVRASPRLAPMAGAVMLVAACRGCVFGGCGATMA